MINPHLSVVIPIHDMKGGADFLWRSVNALAEQSFQDFEIVIVKQGRMAENTNAGIKRAKGDLIKILYLDDHLAHKDALQNIVDAFKENDKRWLITGTDNNPNPYWTDDILSGNNHLGSPSALTIRRDVDVLFDEQLSWLLDVVYYYSVNAKYGPPIILEGAHVNMGIGPHQMTNILTDEQKAWEFNYLTKNYV